MTVANLDNVPQRPTHVARTGRLTIVAVLQLILAVAYASTARAETDCLPYEKAVEHLRATYAEAPVAMGLDSSGQLVQLFRAADGETWTLVFVSPDGLACALAEGETWSEMPLTVAGRAS